MIMEGAMYKLVGTAFCLGVLFFIGAGDLLIASLFGVGALIWAATTPVFKHDDEQPARNDTTLRLR
jgi:hypothetical protein